MCACRHNDTPDDVPPRNRASRNNRRTRRRFNIIPTKRTALARRLLFREQARAILISIPPCRRRGEVEGVKSDFNPASPAGLTPNGSRSIRGRERAGGGEGEFNSSRLLRAGLNRSRSPPLFFAERKFRPSLPPNRAGRLEARRGMSSRLEKLKRTRDYLCRTKLDNYCKRLGVSCVSRGFSGKHPPTLRPPDSRRSHTRSPLKNAFPRLIGRERSPEAALKFRPAASAPAKLRARDCIHGFIHYLMSSQFPRTSPVGSPLVRNNGGKVGRTVSTFRKAVYKSTCILVDDGTLLASRLDKHYLSLLT